MIEIYVSAPDPNDGDVIFRLETPIQAGASVPQPTDAELEDLGNALLNSDYIQNRSWPGGATLVSVQVRETTTRPVYPAP